MINAEAKWLATERPWLTDSHCLCGCGLPVRAFEPGTVVWRGRCWARSCYSLARGVDQGDVAADILKTLSEKP